MLVDIDIEAIILNNFAKIETWFRKQWQLHSPQLTVSVDLRHSGYKLSPIDTNLFPAGFNNLSLNSLPLCIQALQATLINYVPKCIRVLLIPENHTRNKYYIDSLYVLRSILIKAGFIVHVAMLEPQSENSFLETNNGEHIKLENIERIADTVMVSNEKPCLIILNNDLSSGMPAILKNIKQKVLPNILSGWFSRRKSQHFECFNKVAKDFAKLLEIDEWVINPYFEVVKDLNFMTQDGLSHLSQVTENLLAKIAVKYKEYGIKAEPFVAIKADNGTYGMGVMTVKSPKELLNLNRKQRTKMSVSKGKNTITQVLVQEGIYSNEKMPNGSFAEPVLYMLGQYVVGGFYRIHDEKTGSENLNAPGMYFEPIAFEKPCNFPCDNLSYKDESNKLYTYGVIARLAALAAAMENSEL